MNGVYSTRVYPERDFQDGDVGLKWPQVIYVQNSVHLAGAQKSLSRILNHEQIRNSEPILVTSERGWLTSFASEIGIRVLTVPFPKSRSLKARLFQNRLFAKRLAQDLRGQLDPERPSVVHANDHPDSLIAYYLAHALGIPSVLTLRSSQMAERDFFKYGCCHHDSIISVGNELYQKASSWMPSAKNRLVYNGVSDDEFYPSNTPTSKVIDKVLVLGSINPLKGWQDVVEALLLIEQNSSCAERPKIVFLGARGSQDPQVALGTHRLREFKTEFRQPVEDYSDQIRQFPLVIHPSQSESFGMAALESVAAGVPLLAASTGMIPRFIDNEGFLYPPSDVDSLSDRMASLFCQTDYGLQEAFQIRETQSRLKQEFSTNSTVKSLIGIYEQAVGDAV